VFEGTATRAFVHEKSLVIKIVSLTGKTRKAADSGSFFAVKIFFIRHTGLLKPARLNRQAEAGPALRPASPA
jgi:hypothetical protein